MEHSRIKSLDERVNVLVFAHGPLLAYASAAHGICIRNAPYSYLVSRLFDMRGNFCSHISSVTVNWKSTM